MTNPRIFVVAAIAALLFVLFLSNVEAEEPAPRHARPGRITCDTVRAFVAMVGPERAEKMARDAGASEERLAAARRCIRDAN